MKTLSIIFIALALILSSDQAAHACSCKNPPTVEQSFEQSAAVFAGKVESVESSDKETVAEFRVDKSWKGADKERVTVKTDTTSCGIDFKKGESYYLFLDRDGDSYRTVPCRRHAGAQEEFLKNKPTLALQKVSGAFIGSSNLLGAAALITGGIFVLAILLVAAFVFKSKRRS
jgi:hypothetical protein